MATIHHRKSILFTEWSLFFATDCLTIACQTCNLCVDHFTISSCLLFLLHSTNSQQHLIQVLIVGSLHPLNQDPTHRRQAPVLACVSVLSERELAHHLSSPVNVATYRNKFLRRKDVHSNK